MSQGKPRQVVLRLDEKHARILRDVVAERLRQPAEVLNPSGTRCRDAAELQELRTLLSLFDMVLGGSCRSAQLGRCRVELEGQRFPVAKAAHL